VQNNETVTRERDGNLGPEKETVIPAFNIPHLPIVELVAAAIADENSGEIFSLMAAEFR
jgi:hypothetical protein